MKKKAELLYRKDAPGTLVGATVDFASMGLRVGDWITCDPKYSRWQRFKAWLGLRPPCRPKQTMRIVKVARTYIEFDSASPPSGHDGERR